MDVAVPVAAHSGERRHAAVSADTSAVLPARLSAVSAGSDVGLDIQISSPRMARVANERSSAGGGVMIGLIASHTPMGIAQRHRLVHSGTSNRGVVAKRDQALIGWQCRWKTQWRTASPFIPSRLGVRHGVRPV